MKKISTLIFLIVTLSGSSLFSQSVTLLPSVGFQTIASTIGGYSPLINSGKQNHSFYSESLRGYLNNSKGRGFFIGYSGGKTGMAVHGFDSTGYKSVSRSIDRVSRIELGYYLLSKRIYFNQILNTSADPKSGMHFQVQPMIGVGYNAYRHSGYYNNNSVSVRGHANGTHNISLLGGANITIGKNGVDWLFISVMKNYNVGRYYPAVGYVESKYGAQTYTQSIHTTNSGMSVTVGMPITMGRKRDNR